MSITVVPISPKTDSTIFTSMVKLVNPVAILYADPLHELVAGVLEDHGHVGLRIEEIVPEECRVQMSASRVSDFIPSLIKLIDISTFQVLEGRPPIRADQGILCLFTSSAVAERSYVSCSC